MEVSSVAILALAYIVPSAWESIAHRYLLHPSRRERARWRRRGTIGQLLRLAHFYHNRIHHQRTFRTSPSTLFVDEHEKQHLDSSLKGEIAERVQANRYGTTITSFWEYVTYVPIPLSINVALSAKFSPNLLIPSALLALVPFYLSKFIHPLLHESESVIVGARGKWLQAATNTSLFRYIQRYHHAHHRRPSRHFNLMLGPDWVFWLMACAQNFRKRKK